MSAPTTEAPLQEHGGGDVRSSRRLRQVRELGILLALVLLIAATTAVNPGFLSSQSIDDLLLGATLLTILAVGQTLVVITRSVDLSVGSVLGLSAFAVGTLFVSFPGLPVPVVALAGVLLGAVCGAVNGALVATARVPALVVTLGTLYVFRGIDYWWASGTQINAADMPASFLGLGRTSVLGVPVPALIALGVVVAAGWYLRSYRSGRELYAIGSEPHAARLSGIPVDRRIFGAFVVNGALAGLAGVLYAARFGTLDATVGSGLELEVVAAAVVGGVAIFGGSGTVYGAALGAVLLTTIGSALPVLRVNAFWQEAVVGLLILVAIGMDRLLAVRAARRLRGGESRGA
ncbi:rhamnose transport system permease protein [Spinactinospora alkalitolerans]|uniref:Autoinducer 2 import system permease protein LsrC n=1 Tax=Spinactinospora alkalitolerans TaxID=687207 RepID=A0A852TTY0_9ACTN|nr:ABC transporter permease [Spinactinospora alkalitolerans]NYE46203.1 rhamnose transport system permease protein [Spinactinospora alkalitolerans]